MILVEVSKNMNDSEQNFTREMKKFPLGIKKIFLPLMYIANDRLGMYTYNK